MAIGRRARDGVIDELAAICGPDRVFAERSAAFNRARVPAPFPVSPVGGPHPLRGRAADDRGAGLARWSSSRTPPDPGRPPSRRTGSTDGAVPLRHGILVDVKLMNQILEIDLANRTVTVGAGHQHAEAQRGAAPARLIYPDNPASYPCSLVGGRIGTNGWSLIGARYGHTRDLVISFEIVLPTGEIIRVGDGGGAKVRQSSSGYQLKHLFMGHQGTLGIVTEATLELVQAAGGRVLGLLPTTTTWTPGGPTGELARSGVATLAGVVLFDERQGLLPAPRRRGLYPAARLRHGRGGVRAVRQRRRGAAGGEALTADRQGIGRRVLGRRDLRRATGRRGTTATRPRCTDARADGQVAPMSWHCEDAAIPYPSCPRSARSGTRSSSDLASAPTCSTTGACSPTPTGQQAVGRHARRDRHRHLGAAAGRRDLGRVGRCQARDRARRRSSTAARSRPATARAAPARSTSCRSSSAAATR